MFSKIIPIFLITLFPNLSYSQFTCNSLTFSNQNTFHNCIDLPTLKATLHWTHNPTTNPTLSMAFTASPPSPNGWVAWAINPYGSGMVGAQAIIAYKPNTNTLNPILVSTYDVKSYHEITMGTISYNVSGLSAEESNGMITVFATWELRGGEAEVNHVWQVGHVIGGKPGKHELLQDNLESRMKLHLVNGPSIGPMGAAVGLSSRGNSKTEALGSGLSSGHGINAAGHGLVKFSNIKLVLALLVLWVHKLMYT